MKLDQLLDGYDWKARLIPTIVVLLPAFVTAYYCFPELTRSPVLLAGSGVVSIALIYFSSMVIRDLGLRSQDAIWETWGGPPSTRFVRQRDNRFSAEQKNRIRSSVSRLFNIRLLSSDEELTNPAKADQVIGSAFREVKEMLRANSAATLVDKHNAEYGFARNLYGSRCVFVSLALAGILISGFADSAGRWSFNAGVSLDVALVTLWLPFAWILLPQLLKRNADTYAERAWMTFLKLVEEKGLGVTARPSISIRS
jgi:hypothetical protein